MNYKYQILENFLNLYWLRPEVAIWRTLDVLQMKSIKINSPSLDFGCGDGTFMFTNMGGRTDFNYDVYKTMSNTTNFFEKRDIHNQITNIKPKIITKPKHLMSIGLDLKQNLLDKANTLHIYDKKIQHNANYKLPFDDKEFQTVFSNIFYWTKNIEKTLIEARRICSDTGKLIIFVPDIKFKNLLIYNKFLKNGYKWAKILDRGIYKNGAKHCYTFEKWETIFNKIGLKIDIHSNFLTEGFIKMWNVGLRPYSPFLIEMSNNLKSNDRTRIKKKVIQEMMPLLKSYIDYEMSKVGKGNCFHMFVLSRN
jgi:hypothetical protein